MGLLRIQKFSKTPTFRDRFFKQKEDKALFISNEKEFASRQRAGFTNSFVSIAVEVLTILAVPEDSYAFLTNMNLNVSSNTIDFGDASIVFNDKSVITGGSPLLRLIPAIDSTGGRMAISNTTFNYPFRLNPGDFMFLDNLTAQKVTGLIHGFFIPRKEIDREIIDKYG